MAVNVFAAGYALLNAAHDQIEYRNAGFAPRTAIDVVIGPPDSATMAVQIPGYDASLMSVQMSILRASDGEQTIGQVAISEGLIEISWTLDPGTPYRVDWSVIQLAPLIPVQIAPTGPLSMMLALPAAVAPVVAILAAPRADLVEPIVRLNLGAIDPRYILTPAERAARVSAALGRPIPPAPSPEESDPNSDLPIPPEEDEEDSP